MCGFVVVVVPCYLCFGLIRKTITKIDPLTQVIPHDVNRNSNSVDLLRL